MAAIYKLDTLRQARVRSVQTTGTARDDIAMKQATTEPASGTAKLLLFTGVRYERLSSTPRPKRQRDILELAD